MFKNMGGNIPGGNFLGGNFPGGNFPGGSLMGGNFPGGNFTDTISNMSQQHQLNAVFKSSYQLSQNPQKSTCARVIIKLQASTYNFIKKETLTLPKIHRPCKFFEIFKNTFLTELLWTTASAGSAFKGDL